jgi:hypothetical protein
MPFNLPLFCSLILRSLGGALPLGPRRRRTLLLLLPLFVTGLMINHFCWLLDELLFPRYRRVQPKEPVFIAGIPRSGTTYMQRLLIQDRARFTGMRLWEIALAPSVLQKRLLLGIAALDRRLGSPLRRLAVCLDARLFAAMRGIHPISLFDAEEDEPLMLNAFASAYLTFAFPFPSPASRYARFDTEVPAPERSRLMRLYRACVQKHLLVFGPDKQYLAKNPSFTAKAASLRAAFPGAHLLFLLRDPFEAAPSTLSLFRAIYRNFMDLPPGPLPVQADTLRLLHDWYAALASAGGGELIRYESAVREPGRIIRSLYAERGWELPPAFGAVLDAAQETAGQYVSRHRYYAADFGLSRDELEQLFGDLRRQLGYGSPEPPDSLN